MTAPQVRADRDAHKVEITVDPAALEGFLRDLAARLNDPGDSLAGLLEELHNADRLADAHDDTLTEVGISRDTAAAWRDNAYDDVTKALPDLVWPLSYPDADRLAGELMAAGEALPVMLPPRDAAAIVGVTTFTLARWSDAGLIECGRTAGGQRRYPEPAVRALAARRAGAA